MCNGRYPDYSPGTDAHALSLVPPGHAFGYQHTPVGRAAREKRRMIASDTDREERDASAEPTFKPISCTAPGITCGVGQKREIKIVADPEIVAEIEAGLTFERDASSEASAKFKPTSCTVPGLTCGTGEKRETIADAEAEPKFTPTSCTVPGLTCGIIEKRKPESEPRFTPTSCTVPGITCGTSEKRETDAEAEPEPEPEPEPKFTPTSCTVPGHTCGQINARDSRPESSIERQPVADADTEDTSHFEPTSCTVPGFSCRIEVPIDGDNTPLTTLKKVVRSTTEPARVGTTALANVPRQMFDPSFDITKWLTLSYPTTTTWTKHMPTDSCTSPGITCAIAVNGLGDDDDGDEFHGNHLPAADALDATTSSSAPSTLMGGASIATANADTSVYTATSSTMLGSSV